MSLYSQYSRALTFQNLYAQGGWPEVGWDMVQREIAKAQGIDVDVNWGAMTEDEKRRALLNDELVQVCVANVLQMCC